MRDSLSGPILTNKPDIGRDRSDRLRSIEGERIGPVVDPMFADCKKGTQREGVHSYFYWRFG